MILKSAAVMSQSMDHDNIASNIEINPLDQIKSSALASVWMLDVMLLAVYLSLCTLHCWRYAQTKQNTILGRSMTTFESTLNRVAFPVGITWSIVFGISTTLIVAAWAIMINMLSWSDISAVVARFKLFLTLFYIGSSLIIIGTSVLAIYAFCVFLKFPKYTTPGMLIKRKQILLLLGLFLILLGSTISLMLFVPYASYGLMAVYYCVTLFPQTAMMGFETEPCLIIIHLDTSHISGPLHAQIAPEPMGHLRKAVRSF
ncbi:hypothetical protein BDF19DRAFT_430825 [Syncephalis fuscata]|nr:hypothetical protein BDF19DRAFT_430825 [Syncephalis fuscata]